MMRRVLIGIAVGLVATLVAGALVVRLSMSSPGGSFDVAGLAAPVDIHFDEHLRPYADAKSIEDALFAEGWLHARYRLWQMELLRRAGNGRLAEGLGADLLSVTPDPADPLLRVVPIADWPAGVTRTYRFAGRGPQGTAAVRPGGRPTTTRHPAS